MQVLTYWPVIIYAEVFSALEKVVTILIIDM